MSNDLTNARSTAVTPATNVSPWREYLNDQGTDFGTFLKFTKGDWTLGEDDKLVPADFRFIVNLEECYVGWVRWWDGKPTPPPGGSTAHLIGRVIDRYRPPPRSALGELDENLWEKQNGKPRDPFTFTVYLAMRGVNDDEVICFTSGSKGGLKAVNKLIRRYDRIQHLQKYKGKMPIVCLDQETYVHDEFGKIPNPKFNVVGWEFWDEEEPPDDAPQQQRAVEHTADPDDASQQRRVAGDLDDEIPF
jgi:hypothetical protein